MYPPFKMQESTIYISTQSGHVKTSHVISSREGHAQKLHHKGTTGVILYQVQKDYVLQDESLLEIVLFGKIDVISWLLMSIAKDWSTHSESLIL